MRLRAIERGRAVVMGVTFMAAALSYACSKDEYGAKEPKVYMPSEGSYVIKPTDTLMLTPRILYDDGTRYEWRQNGAVVSAERDYMVVADRMMDYRYDFTVWNSIGKDSASIFVRVAVSLSMDEMDNTEDVKSGKIQYYPDNESGTEIPSFVSEGVAFANVVGVDSASWTGFAWSAKTTETQTIGSDALGTAYVPGSDVANKYLAVSGSGDAAVIDFGGRNYTPVSMDFANDNLLYLVAKFGAMTVDSTIVNPVGKNDYYRVVVEGVGSNGLPDGSRVSVDLIECSYDNPAKYVRVSDWKTVDLRAIGSVGRLQLSVETNRDDFPRLFCVDNLVLQD